jgi:hypothetical protein
MILYHHGQALFRRVQRRALGNRPGLESAVEFEPKIVMEIGGVMALDAEG